MLFQALLILDSYTPFHRAYDFIQLKHHGAEIKPHLVDHHLDLEGGGVSAAPLIMILKKFQK